jgi:hypothetical protein
VAEDLTFFNIGAPFVHMKVGPADVSRGEPDNDIGRFLDLGIWDVVDRNLFGTMIN